MFSSLKFVSFVFRKTRLKYSFLMKKPCICFNRNQSLILKKQEKSNPLRIDGNANLLFPFRGAFERFNEFTRTDITDGWWVSRRCTPPKEPLQNVILSRNRLKVLVCWWIITTLQNELDLPPLLESQDSIFMCITCVLLQFEEKSNLTSMFRGIIR